MTWAQYWREETTIYVSDRHRRVHYDAVAGHLIGHLPARHARVVDYGCGDALSAHLVADACAHLYLCDSSPAVRARLARRCAVRPNISVISAHDFEQLPDGSIDLIVVNSVIQYLSTAELSQLLAVSRAKLEPAGRLVIADVIPRSVGPLTDSVQLLRFAMANGFLLAAAVGLVRSFFSNYRRVRTKCGLLRLDEEEIVHVLGQAGFSAGRHYPNAGNNAERMTFVAMLVGRSMGARSIQASLQPVVSENA